MPYYLVCPVVDDSNEPGPCYWMRDGGDRWNNFVKGEWPVKKDNDLVKEKLRVGHVSELDWHETPLRDPSSSSGWLSRGGRYFGCPSYWHDKFAPYVLGISVDEMEAQGWVRVNDSKYYTCEKELSAEQKNWLAHKGYKIYSS
ncbi:MAG: hypothetical protein BMS9Abin23_0166 [Thermodesulfobacteriota bacterium]|nr:MAG: hypothetical protein BMS9Abin23_0166 [Thermodesulfobacteriota bacterium]